MNAPVAVESFIADPDRSILLPEPRGKSRLERLPPEVLQNVWNHMEPRTAASAARASKTMLAYIRDSGVLKTARLIQLAETTSELHDIDRSVFEEIIAETADPTIPLTSGQRIEILRRVQYTNITTNSGRMAIELMKSLNPEHQGDIFSTACNLIGPARGEENNEFFDGLADIAVSLQSDLDKSRGLELMFCLDFTRESDRRTRFSRLEPLYATLQSEQVKGVCMVDIVNGIFRLPMQERNALFEKYAEVAATIQDLDAKAHAFQALPICLWHLPEEARRTAFDRLVDAIYLFDDRRHRLELWGSLNPVVSALPEAEQVSAQASLDSATHATAA